MNGPRVAAIDPNRTTGLDDGWRAAVCVDQDGHESLWLVSPAPQHLAGCACRTCAPHDHLDTTTTTWRSTA